MTAVLTENPHTRRVVQEISKRLQKSGHSKDQADALARRAAKRSESGESTIRKK